MGDLDIDDMYNAEAVNSCPSAGEGMWVYHCLDHGVHGTAYDEAEAQDLANVHSGMAYRSGDLCTPTVCEVPSRQGQTITITH